MAFRHEEKKWNGCFEKYSGAIEMVIRDIWFSQWMMERGCLWNPGGLLPDLPQLTKPSQAVGQKAPIFGCNVCNKEMGGTDGTPIQIFPSPERRPTLNLCPTVEP